MRLSDKPTAVTQVQAVSVGGLVVVPGGEVGGAQPTAIVEAYNPRSDRWEMLPALPQPRSRYALAAVEGKVYLIGGWDGTKVCAEVWMYDPSVKTWQAQTALPTPRMDAGVTVIEGQIYVIGGANAQVALTTNERYTPSREGFGPWATVAPLPRAIGQPAVTTASVVAIAFDAARHEAWQYAAATDAWTAVVIPAEMPLSDRAAVLGSKILVFGSDQNQQASVVSEYQAVYTTFLPFTP